MKDKDYLNIEAYLQGELPAVEAADVETRAAAEPAFFAALEGRRLLNDHLRAEAREPALRETLSQLTAKHFLNEATSTEVPREKGHQAKVKQLNPRSKSLTRWVTGVVAAAAVALLLIFGGRAVFNDQASTYEQFAQHQPLSITERGEGDNGITDAEAAFNDGRYEEVIGPLVAYTTLNKDDARARLALGISYLETGDNAEAVRVLTEVAENGGSVAPYGNWYLALAAVHRNDNSAALRYLDRIPAGDSFLEERIVELRDVLAE
jgi:hypothetical protein